MDKIYYYKIAIVLFFILGLTFGFSLSLIFQEIIISNTISNLRIEKVELGFNETYVMDRFNSTINSITKDQLNKRINYNLIKNESGWIQDIKG